MRSRSMPRLSQIILAFLSLGLLSRPASAATLSVPSQYATIQAAVNAAQNGDTVLIADGTYTGPGNVDIDFGGKNLTVTSQNGAGATIIDCQGSANANHRGFYLHSGETNAVISGFTIQNGFEGGNGRGGNGGGIYEGGSGLTVQSCVFNNNAAPYGFGGGLYASTGYGNSTSPAGSATAVINCVFTGNAAGYGGGALFGGNSNGSSFSVTNCTMLGNTKGRYGSTVENASYPSAAGAVALTNDIIYGDSANGGGEIANEGNGSANAAVAFCDIQGGYAGTGNINADPVLAASPADLHLQQSSPCVGAGTVSGAPALTVDGKTRPNPPSIGAYEASSTLSVPSQYATIQAAVTAAVSGSIILIADGTYTGSGNVDIDFGGKTLTIASQHGAASTIINCQGSASANHRGFYLHSGEINPIISGLTIQNGYTVETPGVLSSGAGGGIFDFSTGLTVQNCIFSNNTAFSGGGLYSSEFRGTLTLINCVFAGNSASAGGGIYGGSGSAVSIINCTVTGNTASSSTTALSGGGISYFSASGGNYPNGSGPVTLTNNIFYGDTGGEIVNNGNGASAVAITCDIQNGYAGAGNISADPIFVSSPSNLHLAAGSPCLGTGTASSAPAVTLDGQARPNPPSIGAYELSPATTTLASSVNPSVSGSGVTFTASVSPTVPGSGSPSGSVTFTVNGFTEPAVTLAHYGAAVGMASYTTSSLAVGSHVVTAAYSGDSQFAPSVSATLTQTVVPHVAPQYVSPAGSDSNPGTQAAPKLTIQAALNVCLSGDTVFIGDGTYTGPGNVDLVMNGQSITVASLNGPARTIINCGGTSSVNHRGFSFNAEASPVLNGLTIENGYEAGGGVYGVGGAVINYSAGLTIENCVIENSTAVEGGGVYSNLSFGAISFINCVLTGNTALAVMSGTSSSGSFGGGISSHTAVNGGGGTLAMTNCTVTGNTAMNGGGVSSLYTTTLSNTILYGNSGGEFYGNAGQVSYCDILGGSPGTGNISANPMFISASDQHLQYGSPCVGAGTASGAPATTIDGKTRPNPPSMGAYEAAMTATATALASGLNPSVAGQSVTFTASVTGTSGTPTGNVTFTLDGTAQTPVTLSAGRAAFITSTLTAGSHTLTAAYSGDQFNAASTSGPLTQTVNAPPPTTFQINSGGKAATPFSADTNFSGGSTYSTSAAVTTAGVANAAPPAVYQTERFGNFAYTLPNLTPGASYTLRLHFAEIYWTAAGKRLFNVAVNGSPALSNFDIFQAAGGADKAVVETVPVTADSSGKVTVTFTSVKDNAKLSGLELLPPVVPAAPAALTATAGNAQVTLSWTASSGAASYSLYRSTSSGAETLLKSGLTGTSYTDTGLTNGTTYFYQVAAVNSAGASAASGEASATPVVPPLSAVIQINSGGGASGGFSADGSFAGGSTYSTSTAVSTAGVANAAPPAVYQSERYGNFVYTLPSLTPSASYTLRLHFAEIYWTAANQRLFNVTINGVSVLTSFDIFQTAGGKNKAVVETFPVTADASGKVTVIFTSIKDNAKLSGLELLH